jgi:hypothetical protein
MTLWDDFCGDFSPTPLTPINPPLRLIKLRKGLRAVFCTGREHWLNTSGCPEWVNLLITISIMYSCKIFQFRTFCSISFYKQVSGQSFIFL